MSTAEAVEKFTHDFFVEAAKHAGRHGRTMTYDNLAGDMGSYIREILPDILVEMSPTEFERRAKEAAVYAGITLVEGSC